MSDFGSQQLELPLSGGGLPYRPGDLVQVRRSPDAPFAVLMEVVACDDMVQVKQVENTLRIGGAIPSQIDASKIERYWRAA